ncbi:peptide-methionine (S)-S-oxide reductase MsrA [Emticicia sp. BO119]|uniref:peptide-methionine (S)-S-oxide reductase MsrA n=1 Tax=Emticicia sp. BO119 TaxID=2757768 RepID=UPI0015EFEF87|nr:peptide-methionine (S)-S-oxide reductase MsrA [Emticicia sp. BO119]
MKIQSIILLGAAIGVIALSGYKFNKKETIMNQETEQDKAVATFGAGCFWCVEAVFQRLDGVTKVESGYMGGTNKNPTYKEVCTGLTGHVEVTEITYNPQKISFEELLEVFWKTHDPTTLNRQGNDVGTQYRSVVFYHDDKQKALAEKYKAELNTAGIYNSPIVTAIEPAQIFYKAENYHQDYYNLNGTQPYCQMVVRPKVEKFEKVFKDKLAKKNQ